MSFVLRDVFGMHLGCTWDALGKSSAPNHLQNYGVFFRDKHPPLLRIDDSFMKYVITGDIIKKYQNDDGIVFMDVFDFLLDKDSI